MADSKLVVDCGTGGARTEPLSQADVTQQQVDQAAGQAREADAATERGAVVTLVQSCVGVTWPNLTPTQKQTLIVALLHKLGALDKTLTVQPLAQWL